MAALTPDGLIDRLRRAPRVWLFLDYDGTLADFAPTPDDVLPDPQLIALLRRLSRRPRLRIAVISGRKLEHVRKLLPLEGVLLGGTYGIELLTPQGELLERADYGSIRPALDALKPQWEALIRGQTGFYLEDKGWTLALHARYAEDGPAGDVLSAARRAAERGIDERLFRILGGHKFLEVGPMAANKARTVAYLLEAFPWPGALPVYLGDDDKDEEAFGAVHAGGGVAIRVGAAPETSRADWRLDSPAAVRDWLARLPDAEKDPKGLQNL